MSKTTSGVWWISWRDPAPLFVYEPGFGLSGVPYLHRRLRTHPDRRPQERRSKLKEPSAHFLILSLTTAATPLPLKRSHNWIVIEIEQQQQHISHV